MPEKSPDLDLLLEKGLAAWAESGPAPGLEERVLASLRRERATTGAPDETTRRWPWSLLAAAALLIAVGGTVLFRYAPPRAAGEDPPTALTAPAPEIVPTPRPAPGVAPSARIARADAPATKRTPTRPRSPSPVREVFPTPSPLGEEDRLLIAYVATTPIDELKNHLGFLDAPAEQAEETKENR